MVRHLAKFVAILLLVAVGRSQLPMVHAQPDRTKVIERERFRDSEGKGLAIVVGVQDYVRLPKLRYCRRDAELLAETLRTQGRFDDVILMTETASEARYRPDRGNLMEELTEWVQMANRQRYARVLVYFSGHGFRDDAGELYFATPTCGQHNLKETALPRSFVQRVLDQAENIPVKLLLLDCCHAGSDKGGAVGENAAEFARVFQSAKGLLTLASCEKDEVSLEWDDRRQGLFTYFLCEGLKGNADADRDGLVDSDELYKFVFNGVLDTSFRQFGRQQHVKKIESDDWRGLAVLADVRHDPHGLDQPPFFGKSWLTVDAKTVDEPRRIAVHQATGRLAVATSNLRLIVWDLHRGEVLAQWIAHKDDTSSLSFAASGDQLISSSADRTAVVWDVATGKSVASFACDAPVHAAAISPNGRIAATSSSTDLLTKGSDVQVWDVPRRGLVSRVPAPLAGVLALAFSPADSQLLFGEVNGAVYYFDPKIETLSKVLVQHRGDVTGLTFSPDGTRVLSTSMDRTALYWDFPSGKIVKAFREHTGGVIAGDLTSAGQRAVTCGLEGPVLVWDPSTAEQLTSVKTFDRQLRGVKFVTVDGSMLATVAAGPSPVHLWNTSTATEVARLYTFARGEEWLLLTATGGYKGSLGGVALLQRGDDDLPPARALSPTELQKLFSPSLTLKRE